jgi:hypothetical protein
MAMLIPSELTNWTPIRGGLLGGLALGLLALACGGCTGIQRCETWDRVTHPDYMYAEETLLHGYHRTTWEAWPAHGFQGMWMKEIHSGETLPTGKPSRELTPPSPPTPEVTPTPTMPETPEAADQGYVPQARRSSSPTRSKNKPRPTATGQPRRPLAEVFRGSVELDDEAIAPTPALVEEPIAASATELKQNAKVDAEVAVNADAQWTGRFAALIAQDRKRAWRKLADYGEEGEVAPAEQESPQQTKVIEPVTHFADEPSAVDAESDVPAPTALETQVRLQPTPSQRPVEPAAADKPLPREGQAEVRWKASSSK